MSDLPIPFINAAEHLGLPYEVVNRWLRRYPHYRYCEDDALSVANLGLMKAAHGFDPARGYKFSTYAFRAILTNLNEWAFGMGHVDKLTKHHTRKGTKPHVCVSLNGRYTGYIADVAAPEDPGPGRMEAAEFLAHRLR